MSPPYLHAELIQLCKSHIIYLSKWMDFKTVFVLSHKNLNFRQAVAQ